MEDVNKIEEEDDGLEFDGELSEEYSNTKPKKNKSRGRPKKDIKIEELDEIPTLTLKSRVKILSDLILSPNVNPNEKIRAIDLLTDLQNDAVKDNDINHRTVIKFSILEEKKDDTSASLDPSVL